ncbi:MAG: hypothetical protein LPK45_04520 [Bacteroidota bacterium]|nr:hypothetical protein [Bacteroidota bacterium]MDX5430319.1 hypothetical protein [Bacteroidota bacterium]MDX5469080.1 hypothetical protein [Bacteroidota bacterium]
MSAKPYLLLISFFFLSLGGQLAMACGTVPGWFEVYKKAERPDDRLDALKFLHCDPVLKLYAKNQAKESAILIRFLEQAISDLDSQKLNFQGEREYAEDLILFNIVRFHLLGSEEWKAIAPIRDFLHKKSKSLLHEEDWIIGQIQLLDQQSKWFSYDGMSLSHDQYAASIRTIIRTLR